MKIRVINNLGVTGNFILKYLAKSKKFPRIKKKDLYDLFILDKSILLSKDRRMEKEILLRTRIY